MECQIVVYQYTWNVDAYVYGVLCTEYSVDVPQITSVRNVESGLQLSLGRVDPVVLHTPDPCNSPLLCSVYTCFSGSFLGCCENIIARQWGTFELMHRVRSIVAASTLDSGTLLRTLRS